LSVKTIFSWDVGSFLFNFSIPVKILPLAMANANDPSNRAPTMKNVAALTGFSPQTVHRALHAQDKVTPETRAIILRVVKEIGYRPNRAARHLATAQSTIIGIVSFATQIYGPAHTILSIDEFAQTRGLNIMLSTVPSLAPVKFKRAVAETAGYSPIGMILLSPIRLTHDFFEDWYGTLPMIVVGECASSAVSVIDHDYAGATQEAVQYLIDLGHTRIACLRGPSDWTPTRFRSLGWSNALKKNGLPLGPVYEGDWSPQSGYEATRALIKNQRKDFTAIVVQNDQMAFGVLLALREAKIRVPQDVSVIGYDDMPEAAFAIPPLTTVNQDYEGIGTTAVNNLIAASRKEKFSSNILLSSPFVVRASTGPVREAAATKKRRPVKLEKPAQKVSVNRVAGPGHQALRKK
jgi:DNA-binding LacI/PurR family transcriptional regulator